MTIQKHLLAEGEMYSVFSHCGGIAVIVERKRDNVTLLMQGDDAWFFCEELYDACHSGSDEVEHVDVVCSWYDELFFTGGEDWRCGPLAA